MSENPQALAAGDRAAVDEAVTELLSATGQLVRRVRAESNPGELTWSQQLALARLDKAGSLTTVELARTEGVKPQSMGATLAALEQEGLVRRQPHPTDGRQVLFALSDSGVELRRRHGVMKREWLLAAVARLSSRERQTLITAAGLLRRLADS